MAPAAELGTLGFYPPPQPGGPRTAKLTKASSPGNSLVQIEPEETGASSDVTSARAPSAAEAGLEPPVVELCKNSGFSAV